MVFKKFLSISIHCLENLASGKISFSAPEMFNDPWDSFIIRDERFLKTLSNDVYTILNKIRIGCFFRCEKLSTKGVLSDKERYLWSIYGDSHKGICLEFEIDDKILARNDDFIYMKHGACIDVSKKENACYYDTVVYHSDFLKYILNVENAINHADVSEIAKQALFQKDDVFNGEDEIRFFVLSDNTTNKFFLKDFSIYLKQITFGCKCKNEDKILVAKIINKRKIKLFQISQKMEKEKYD